MDSIIFDTFFMLVNQDRSNIAHVIFLIRLQLLTDRQLLIYKTKIIGIILHYEFYEHKSIISILQDNEIIPNGSITNFIL